MPYYRRNLIVLSATIFLAALSWNQIMPFLPFFLEEMGIKGDNREWWIGIVFAAQAAASIIAQPFWGKLGDTYGRKPMIIRAGFFLSCIYLAMSFCQTPWQLLIIRFLNGALTGFIPGSFALIATNTPEELAPRSVATAQTASAVGQIAGPALGGLLAANFGYRGSMIVSGVAVLVSTITVWILVEEPNKVAPLEKTSLIEDFKISLRSPVQVSILFAVMLSWIFGQSINPYLAPYLRELSGGSLSVRDLNVSVGVIVAMPAVAFILAAHYWSRLGERLGYDRTILFGLVGGGIGTFILAVAPNLWIFGVLYFIVGLVLAAIAPSIAAITCTKVDESFRGRAYGIQNSAGTIGGMTAPIIAGYIATTAGYTSIFIFVGTIFVSGAFIFQTLVKRWNTKKMRRLTGALANWRALRAPSHDIH